jgi:hypothetical protein
MIFRGKSAKKSLPGQKKDYLAGLPLRAARDKKSAKTRARTIPVLTPISIRARLKNSICKTNNYSSHDFKDDYYKENVIYRLNHSKRKERASLN